MELTIECGGELQASRRLGCDGGYLGMRMAESRLRRRLLESRGPVYWHRGDGIWRCCPLWDWSTAEVWHATDVLGVPVHPVYSQTATAPRQDAFDAFLEDRRRRLSRLIESAMGKPVVSAGGAEDLEGEGRYE